MKVREMQESDFEEVHDTFLAGENLHDSPEDYRPLFSTQWARNSEACGFVLEEAGRLVGVLGTLFSERLIEGRTERFCNLHTWFVEEEYRSYSMALMRPVTRMRDCTITDLSPSQAVVQISRRLGFQELDSRLTMLLPVRSRSGTSLMFSEAALDDDSLGESDRAILRDHAHLPCEGLWARNSTGQGCLIIHRTIPQRFRYCYLHYVSNWDFFKDHSIAIRRELARRSGCRLVAINRRSIDPNRLPRSLTLPVGIPQLYKSHSVEPTNIDSLYSEVLINNWPLVPNLRAGMRTLAEDWGMLQENESLKGRMRRFFSLRKHTPAPIETPTQA